MNLLKLIEGKEVLDLQVFNHIFFDEFDSPKQYAEIDSIYTLLEWLHLKTEFDFKRAITFYYMSYRQTPKIISISKKSKDIVNWYKEFCSDMEVESDTMIYFH